jgi:hypothetical protein
VNPSVHESKPVISVADMQRRLATELSTSARLGYVVLLISSVAMVVVLTTLWISEPVLPARTQWAFGLMMLIATSWIVFAIWTLARRRVLLVRHRLIAARMGVGFSAAFVAFFLLLVAVGAIESATGRVALSMAVPLLLAALMRLRVVRRQYNHLTSRYRELDAGLRTGASAVNPGDGRS